MAKMKTYRWQGHRSGIGQTIEMVAAPSKAAAARAAGVARPAPECEIVVDDEGIS